MTEQDVKEWLKASHKRIQRRLSSINRPVVPKERPKAS